MDLFLAFLFTIAISLVLSFVLANLLSIASSEKVVVIEKPKPKPEPETEPKFCDCECGGRIGIDNDKTEPTNENKEAVSKGCESPTTENKEVKVVELREKPVEEASELGYEDNLVDESPKLTNLGEIEVELLVKSEVEVGEVLLECGGNDGSGFCLYKNEVDGVKDKLFDDDDDWEGIERTELEKRFAAAVVFVGSKDNANRVSGIGRDVKTNLYGLHKIATQGPCHDPQPMALKLSARAKWNAWQRLGNMCPEVAMEQYISLLSRSIPGWMQDDFGVDSKQVFAESEAFGKLASDLKTLPPFQLGAVDERKLEVKPCVEGFVVTGYEVHTP